MVKFLVWTKQVDAECYEIEVPEEAGNIAPYFVEEIRQELVSLLGQSEIFTGGLRVTTTLDQQHQKAANLAVEKV